MRSFARDAAYHGGKVYDNVRFEVLKNRYQITNVIYVGRLINCANAL
jgi:hypothetical protein